MEFFLGGGGMKTIPTTVKQRGSSFLILVVRLRDTHIYPGPSRGLGP
jgi:hypothetical protein